MKRNSKNLRHYKDVTMKIWKERPHKCEFCGDPIGYWDSDIGEMLPKYENFQHIERGRGKDVWDNPDKIKLICLKCHMKQDSGLTLKT